MFHKATNFLRSQSFYRKYGPNLPISLTHRVSIRPKATCFAAWERAARPQFEAAPWPPTHAPLAVRSLLPLPELRSLDCASSVGSDVLRNRPRVIRVTRVAEDRRGS